MLIDFVIAIISTFGIEESMNCGIKNLIDKYESVNLVIKILIGILIGVAGAFLLPSAKYISLFGDLCVGALKSIAPILVFILVISSLSCGVQKQDGRFRLVIFFYLLSTFTASIVAVCASFIFPQTLVLSTDSEFFDYFKKSDVIGK